MLVTPAGMVMDVKLSQSKKALSLMLVSDEPAAKVTDAKFSLMLNAPSPMLATLAGMETDVNLMLPLKASSPMVVTVEGMVYVVASFPAGYWISVVLVLLNSTPSSLA